MDDSETKERLRGVAFTTPTPFSEDGTSLEMDRYRTNLQYVYDAGGRLFVPCGNTGEYYSLSDDERVEVVKTTVETVGDGGTVLAGAGGSIKNAAELIAQYEAIGVDAVMIMHPSHAYIHEKGLVNYYRKLAARTSLGVVVYKRGPELSNKVLQEVVSIDNVIGVKYAQNDIKAFSRLVNRSDDDVVWINGLAERFAPAFALEGAEGFTTGIGNFVPEMTLRLNTHIDNREWDEAKSVRDSLRQYEDLREETGDENTLSAANNVPVIKHGLELAGLYGGPVREPLEPLSREDEARARRYYDELESMAHLNT